ncbi:902_t:CDS:2, partial [Cetraspora pellucida]
CAAKPASFALTIVSVGITLFVFSICSFCYFQIVRTVRVVKKAQTQVSLSNDTNKSLEHSISDVELRVTVKVLGYVLVFILQWGIGNAIFYIINEGLNRTVDNCKSSLTTCQTTEQIVLNSNDINDSDLMYENVENRFSRNLSKRSLDVIPDGSC